MAFYEVYGCLVHLVEGPVDNFKLIFGVFTGGWEGVVGSDCCSEVFVALGSELLAVLGVLVDPDGCVCWC